MKICKVDEYEEIKGDRREHWRTIYTSVTDCWQSVQERSSRNEMDRSAWPIVCPAEECGLCLIG